MTADEALESLGVSCIAEDGAIKSYRAVVADVGAALVVVAGEDADRAWLLLGALIGHDAGPLRAAGHTVSGVIWRLGWA
jgi:hypothetical protein